MTRRMTTNPVMPDSAGREIEELKNSLAEAAKVLGDLPTQTAVKGERERPMLERKKGQSSAEQDNGLQYCPQECWTISLRPKFGVCAQGELADR